MTMHDYYEPDPPLTCPVCGSSLARWQGGDGPGAMFLWRQGLDSPAGWLVDEELRPPGALLRARLPKSFTISTVDDLGHHVVATCEAPEGLWTEAGIIAVLESHSGREGRVYTRVLWGEAPWLPKSARDR